MLEKIDLSKRVAKDTYKKGMEEAGESWAFCSGS